MILWIWSITLRNTHLLSNAIECAKVEGFVGIKRREVQFDINKHKHKEYTSNDERGNTCPTHSIITSYQLLAC